MTDMPYTPKVTGTGVKASIQRFGGYLAGMVMPNIGAFIAWGLITAMFIPTGWLPNETFAQLVGPMITLLLPILIGYTGGRMVHGQRGAVVGAVATVGVAIGSDVPMFLGAMIIGPLTAFILRLFDKLIEGKVKPGFEGGQMPLHMRLPKVGFRSHKKHETAEVFLYQLDRFEGEVDFAALRAAKLVPSTAKRAKIVKKGDVSKKLVLKGLMVTAGARAAIEAAGGRIEE